MSGASSSEITQLLLDLKNGDKAAIGRLMPLVHSELKRIAARYMRSEANRSILQTTVLVNEAYLRLMNAKLDVETRAHFFAIAAGVMRQILVDYARLRSRQKRGGGRATLDLDKATVAVSACADEMIALDEALSRLSTLDERKSRVVELRFFGGLDVKEIAILLGVSENTVIRDWSLARAWLRNELTAAAG
jgi:RNA polymerase sigma factor (TIGR02999 family)